MEHTLDRPADSRRSALQPINDCELAGLDDRGQSSEHQATRLRRLDVDFGLGHGPVLRTPTVLRRDSRI